MQAVVKCVLEPFQYGEVTLHFVDESQICRLHKQFFNDPSPTDCITLPIDPPGRSCDMLGEVFICPQTAIKYAQKQNADPYQELTLYIVHGLLHLLGYKDIEQPDQDKMRAAEKKCMDLLTAKDLILTPKECT